ERLAAVLDGFVFDAPAPWHDPAAIARAVDEAPRPVPAQPTPPRSTLPDQGPEDSLGSSPSAAIERLTEVAESLLGSSSRVALAGVLRSDWPSARRLLADLTTVDLRPELPYRLVWADDLTISPGEEPAWLSHGFLERIS
ncbi:MAG TPA: hypothetical protein VM347_26785, partial [Nonomuraea sp.]|nr:hypothetical protein [Nonomuraea sp.]